MQRIDWIRRLFPILAVLWAGALPLAAAPASPDLHSGPVALVSGAVYAAGAVVCHQRPERSFTLNGRRLPVCARCTGIYVGAAAAALALTALRRRRPEVRRPALIRAAALAAVLPTAATLVWEWSVGRAPENGIRALAGLPIGVLVSWIVMRAASWPPPSRETPATGRGVN